MRKKPVHRARGCEECGELYIPKTANGKYCSDSCSTKRHLRVREDSRLRRNYGISLEEHAKLLEAQGGKCAICKKARYTSTDYKLSVDHCHKTGRVRGLLCGNCNRGIGFFQENIEYLNNSIKYIEEHRINAESLV